ncbi:hypothetical protein [Parenemella sanctibonifatiensis]|uniref:FAD-dependent oxidoreductase n=1 Tax=Parenemella sanctibonifatiensis TaxID=2016505 RepID=A0A255EA07_9ACTN|nr:hypothetical protein [Parenemella sanctibonifatiensis]OYN88346.1 hypothetical protein CGZ92_05295 [Parenemella sanctibonifatiensis]
MSTEQPPEAVPVAVIGSDLGAVATAARLARLGHRTTLLSEEEVLVPEGRGIALSTWPGDLGPAPMVDDLPLTTAFPAPWRDLFKKTGMPLEGSLAKAELALSPAPATRHRFSDGSELVLPNDRSTRQVILRRRYGAAAAQRWETLLRQLTDVWQRQRALGLEQELTSNDQIRRAALPGGSITGLARSIKEPHLAAVIRSTAWLEGNDPRLTPGFRATPLALAAVFGEWMVTHHDQPVRFGHVVDALLDRLAVRGVEILAPAAVLDISRTVAGRWRITTATGEVEVAAATLATDLWQQAELTGAAVPALRRARGLRRAIAPRVQHWWQESPLDEPEHVVEHHRDGIVESWRRAYAGGTLVTEHVRRRGGPDATVAAWRRGSHHWLRRPPIRLDASLTTVSASGRGGGSPQEVLLAAALASYALHEELTGEDVRPTNKTPPPRRPQALPRWDR